MLVTAIFTTGDEICAYLRELRIKAGFTQEELADILMTTQATISKIENKLRVPDAPTKDNWVAVCTSKSAKFTYHHKIAK